MSKKGVGSVVAVVIITLLAIVSASIFLGVYLKSTRENTSKDTSSCIGIELKVNTCYVYNETTLIAWVPSKGDSLLLNVERLPGGKEIRGLRFVVTNASGADKLYEPTNFSISNFKVDTD